MKYPQPPPADPRPDAAPRLVALDVVRGVAVLGIVVANIVAFGQPMIAYSWPGGFLTDPGPFADWLWGAQLILVDGKFRGIFTLLFGAGLVLFHRRALARRQGPGLLARRLGWLALFGFLHWLLLWRGDILMAYAIGGLVVLAFVDWDWIRQLALGLIGYGVGAVADLATTLPAAYAAHGNFPPRSTLAAAQATLREAQATGVTDGKVEAALTAAGDQAGLIRHAITTHLPGLPGDTVMGLYETVPLMLIGMALLNLGVFSPGSEGGRQRLWGWGLWIVGTLAAIPIAAWAIGRGITYWDSFAAISGFLALPQLAAATGLTLLLALWGQAARGRIAARLAVAGQCAFTNYVGTSALALLVFSGLGLGLFGKLGRLELYAIVPLFWLVMLAWPAWWLKRFRYGPLEWLWRCLTYGQRMPLRR